MSKLYAKNRIITQISAINVKTYP